MEATLNGTIAIILVLIAFSPAIYYGYKSRKPAPKINLKIVLQYFEDAYFYNFVHFEEKVNGFGTRKSWLHTIRTAGYRVTIQEFLDGRKEFYCSIESTRTNNTLNFEGNELDIVFNTANSKMAEGI